MVCTRVQDVFSRATRLNSFYLISSSTTISSWRTERLPGLQTRTMTLPYLLTFLPSSCSRSVRFDQLSRVVIRIKFSEMPLGQMWLGVRLLKSLCWFRVNNFTVQDPIWSPCSQWWREKFKDVLIADWRWVFLIRSLSSLSNSSASHALVYCSHRLASFVFWAHNDHTPQVCIGTHIFDSWA